MRARRLLVLPGALLGCFVLVFALLPIPGQCQEAPAKQGLRGEYYEWSPDLGNTPDRADVFKPENLKIVRLDATVNFN